MSERYPRSIRTTDELWSKVETLAKLADVSRSKFVEEILEKTASAILRGYDLKKPHDRAELKKILKEIV